MNPILLGTIIGGVIGSHKPPPMRGPKPHRRRGERSSGGFLWTIGGGIRAVLKYVAHELSIRRRVAKTTSLCCPHCKSPSLVPKKGPFIAFECQRCHGVWVNQKDLEKLTLRASRNFGISNLSRLRSWEDVFKSAHCNSPHRGRVEASAPCGDNVSQEHAPVSSNEEEVRDTDIGDAEEPREGL